MVSLEAPFSPKPNSNRKPNEELFDSNHYQSKKRKLEEIMEGDRGIAFHHRRSSKSSIFDIERHLETPLPLEWERCLDIQSGEIHFYNTRTQKKTTGDPRGSAEQPSDNCGGGGHMSLDLELNLLPCDSSQRKNQATTAANNDIIIRKQINSSPPRRHHHHLADDDLNDNKMNKMKKSSSASPGDHHHHLSRCPSWLAFDQGDDNDQQQEMVATACMRCHMLVMLCKASLTCPNCKFVHPPDQSPPKLFKPRLSLL